MFEVSGGLPGSLTGLWETDFSRLTRVYHRLFDSLLQLIAQGIVLMLGLVQWMNPQWGWVLPGAVLLPLAAHLLSQRSGRLAYFPAVRFVQKAIALQSRWYSPRHWLLLLLRMLILALVIAAFAQPTWWRDDALARDNHQGLAVVLILDASASMQRTSQGSTLFDIARAQTLAALASLDASRDRAMVIVMDASPAPLLPRMSANFSVMRDELLTLEPTFEQGNLSAALAMATKPAWDPSDLAATAPLAIHLYSDMQRTQWPADAQLRTLLADRTFIPHDVTGNTSTTNPSHATDRNLALHEATMTPAQPVRGQRATISVEAASYAPSSTSPVDVNVIMTNMTNQSQKQVRRVRLTANTKQRVSFTWQPVNTGPAYIALSIQFAPSGASNAFAAHDALPFDNQTGLYVHVDGTRHVALVTAANVDQPTSSAYYLKRALAPSTNNAVNDVQLQIWSPASLASQLYTPGKKSTPPACVVMVETGSLDAPALSALEIYMQRGGGVWWLLDSQQAADALANWRNLDGPLSPVLPAKNVTSNTITTTSNTTSMRQINRIDGIPIIGSGSYDRPILSIFQGPARAAINDIYFQSTFEGMLAPDAQGLLYFTHVIPDTNARVPVLAYRNVGRGMLALLAANITPASSNFVKNDMFLPLVHQMVQGLSPQHHTQSNPVAGTAAWVALDTFPGSNAFDLIRPDGSRIANFQNTFNNHPELKQMSQSGTMHFQLPLPLLSQPGRYTLRRNADDKLLGGVQVELASSESNLAGELPGPIAAHVTAAANPATPQKDVVQKDVVQKVTRALPTTQAIRDDGLSLWPYLLMTTAILLALESLICGSDSWGSLWRNSWRSQSSSLNAQEGKHG